LVHFQCCGRWKCCDQGRTGWRRSAISPSRSW